jgi:hypothetical protein
MDKARVKDCVARGTGTPKRIEFAKVLLYFIMNQESES